MKRITKCFIRPNVPCGRSLAAANDLCFIAVPSSEEFYPDLQEIIRVLESEGIRGYAAIFDQQPGKEIFCEKICSKIIEAQFCVAVLNDVLDEPSGKRFPNANVYLEYGLMLGLGKTVLPLQRSGLPLPFDVNHIEVLKYRQTNLASKLRPFVANVKVSGQPRRRTRTPARRAVLGKSPLAARFSRALELEGFREASPASFKLMPTDDIGYLLYEAASGELVYATAYEGTDGLDPIVLNTKILLRRVADAFNGVVRAIRVFKQKRYTALLREWEDALRPLGRICIVVGLAQGDSKKILDELISVVLASQVPFPLPKVEVWDHQRIAEIEKLP